MSYTPRERELKLAELQQKKEQRNPNHKISKAVLESKDVNYLVIDAIHQKGSMSKKEIIKLTGWSRRTYARRIEYILDTFDDEVYYNSKTHKIHSKKINKESLA